LQLASVYDPRVFSDLALGATIITAAMPIVAIGAGIRALVARRDGRERAFRFWVAGASIAFLTSVVIYVLESLP